MIQNQPKTDWVNLPSNSVVQSLWTTLHDGKLLSIRSDLYERTITLEVDIAHVRSFHKLGELARFIITFHGVESVRANTFAIWPGETPDVQGKSYEEQSRLIREFQAKGREESVGWRDFVAAFPSNSLDIYNAEMASDGNNVTIQIQGTLDGNEFDDQYFSIFIRSAKIEFWQSDDCLLSFEQFVKLGNDYWEAWETQK